MVEADRPQMTIIRRIRIALRLPKAKDAHSEYVILTDFPRQQWLGKRTTMLRCTCTAFLFFFHLVEFCDSTYMQAALPRLTPIVIVG